MILLLQGVCIIYFFHGLLSTESSIVDPNSDWNTLGGICNCPMQFKIQNLIKIITELTTNACLKMVIEQEFS